MFLAFLPLMIAVVFMLRFLALDFLARIWLPKARSRASLPEPVILMRLAVALWVFNFGIKLLSFLLINNIVAFAGRYNQRTVEVGNYFFRIPTDKLRPENCGFPSTTASSLRISRTLFKSSFPSSL